MEIKEWLNDFKKDFSKGKKSYLKWSITGGVLYTLLGLYVFLYLFAKGMGGSQINPVLFFFLNSIILAPKIIGILFELFEYILPDFMGYLVTVLYVLSQFFVGFCISALIYYFIRRKRQTG